jgi:hypothetical protein
MIREGFEDYYRHVSDNELNSSKTHKVEEQSLKNN